VNFIWIEYNVVWHSYPLEEGDEEGVIFKAGFSLVSSNTLGSWIIGFPFSLDSLTIDFPFSLDSLTIDFPFSESAAIWTFFLWGTDGELVLLWIELWLLWTELWLLWIELWLLWTELWLLWIELWLLFTLTEPGLVGSVLDSTLGSSAKPTWEFLSLVLGDAYKGEIVVGVDVGAVWSVVVLVWSVVVVTLVAVVADWTGISSSPALWVNTNIMAFRQWYLILFYYHTTISKRKHFPSPDKTTKEFFFSPLKSPTIKHAI
jgi:hypothetical protein